jgi:hypothetical protein
MTDHVKEFSTLEGAILDRLANIKQLLENEDTEVAKEAIGRLIGGIKEYQKKFEHGEPRNMAYADLLLNYLPHFVCPFNMLGIDSMVQNGSCFLVKLKDKTIAVTNYHVIQEWKRLIEQEAAKAVTIGNTRLSPDSLTNIIDYSESLDLATILLSTKVINDLQNSNVQFYEYASQVELCDGDLVFALGFPGALRNDDMHKQTTENHVAVIQAKATNVDGRKFWIEFERESWIQRFGEKDIKDLTGLGGFSGGPVFFFRDGELHLAGIIFENIGFIDGMQCIKFENIKDDGTIDKPDW